MTETKTSEPDGRRRRGDQSRAQVLGRAIQVASVQGLSGLTIGGLAADLGISKGNITVLFGDKESLQVRTLDAAVDLFVEKVIAPARKVASPRRRLLRMCDGWFDFVEDRVLPGGCMLQASMNEYRARPGPVQDRVKAHRTAWFQLLEQAVAAGKAAGEFRVDADPEQVAFEINAFQAAANAACLLGDGKSFKRARKACRNLVAALTPEPDSHG